MACQLHKKGKISNGLIVVPQYTESSVLRLIMLIGHAEVSRSPALNHTLKVRSRQLCAVSARFNVALLCASVVVALRAAASRRQLASPSFPKCSLRSQS